MRIRWYYILLALASAAIYSAYFSRLLSAPDSILASARGDGLKNYYTYLYHIYHDRSWIAFGGMNHPFGEHVIYTDCIPLLTLILRPLTFLHGSLVGTLHMLLLVSFVITPLLLFRLLHRMDAHPLAAACVALGTTLLSPQLLRLTGHFSLAFAWVIPLLLLRVHSVMMNRKAGPMIALSLYCFLLFFIHPYFGFGASLFSMVALVAFHAWEKRWRSTMGAVVVALMPVAAFRLFMLLTDTHEGRPASPYGAETMTSSVACVFTPFTGPFRHFMQQIIKVKQLNWEGLSYTGIASFFMSAAALIIILVQFRRTRFDATRVSLLFASLVLLALSFGLPETVSGAFSFMRQFRAPGRFAWYFYYTLPLVMVPWLCRQATLIGHVMLRRVLTAGIPLVFLCFNAVEAHAFFRLVSTDSFSTRNIFNPECLSSTELALVDRIGAGDGPLLPLPYFHIGSEVYSRNGLTSAPVAFMISYLTGRPLKAVMMSRTSKAETEASLSMFRCGRPALGSPLIIKVGESILPDERQLIEGNDPVFSTDSVEVYKYAEPGPIAACDDRSVLQFHPQATGSDHCMETTIAREAAPDGRYILAASIKVEDLAGAGDLKVVLLRGETVISEVPVMQSIPDSRGTVVVLMDIDISSDHSYRVRLNACRFGMLQSAQLIPPGCSAITAYGGKRMINGYVCD